MRALLWTWTAWAWAGEPDLEIVVEDTPNPVQARRELTDAIRGMGYLPGLDLGGRTVYLPLQPWKPWISVNDAGFVLVRGHAVTPLLITPQQDQPGASATFLVSSRRAVMAEESRVFADLRPLVTAWQDALAEEALAFRREQVRQQLWAIWERGEGPDGQPLDSPAARRAAVARMWLDTADNGAGEQVRVLIDDYIDQTVQRSPHPFTAEEVSAINAENPFERPFWPAGR
ncbi:MAG: hypothetical protein H6739_41710 [Alphaproteobacteria bacterium]|nr:hypothetical protein [Alphaproteobacteria bacterium]